jgi:tRNA(Ile)-lysidine synthase
VSADGLDRLAEAISDSGLIGAGSHGVALLSGGADSACLAAGLCASFGGPGGVRALHINYGLRADSDEDEAACAALCKLLGIQLSLERVSLPEGNLQEAAREARYAEAERLRSATHGDWIATGHTRTDLAETLIYRLAVSPGRRPLLGLPARRGRVVRPLLSLTRTETREIARGAALPFKDDPSNTDVRFGRVRIREQVLPALRELNPAAEEHIAATWAELAEEADALEAIAARELDAAGAGSGVLAVQAEALAELHPALRRVALRHLAERAAGADVPLSRARAAEIWRLARKPEGGEVQLGHGVSAICEAGTVRFSTGAQPAPEAVMLRVPGSCRFGRWDVQAEILPAPVRPIGPEVAVLDAEAVGGELEVRAWSEGDRMRPLGLGGSKSLQDLFTDRRVPRSLRHTLPVVTSGERIAWVAGVAVSEEFRLSREADEVAVLSARLEE